MLECPKCRSVRCGYGMRTSLVKSGGGLTNHLVVVCDDCMEITEVKEKKDGSAGNRCTPACSQN